MTEERFHSIVVNTIPSYVKMLNHEEVNIPRYSKEEISKLLYANLKLFLKKTRTKENANGKKKAKKKRAKN